MLTPPGRERRPFFARFGARPASRREIDILVTAVLTICIVSCYPTFIYQPTGPLPTIFTGAWLVPSERGFESDLKNSYRYFSFHWRVLSVARTRP